MANPLEMLRDRVGSLVGATSTASDIKKTLDMLRSLDDKGIDSLAETLNTVKTGAKAIGESFPEAIEKTLGGIKDEAGDVVDVVKDSAGIIADAPEQIGRVVDTAMNEGLSPAAHELKRGAAQAAVDLAANKGKLNAETGELLTSAQPHVASATTAKNFIEGVEERLNPVSDEAVKDQALKAKVAVQAKAAKESATDSMEEDKEPVEATKEVTVTEVDPDRLNQLFQNTHGTPFDPKSSMDKKKMETVQRMLEDPENEGLTDNQLSLKIYRL